MASRNTRSNPKLAAGVLAKLGAGCVITGAGGGGVSKSAPMSPAIDAAASPGPFSVPVYFANAFSALQRTVQTIAEEQKHLIEGVRYQGSQLDDLDKRFADVPEALGIIRSLIEERDGLQRRVMELEDHVDRLEQQSRANNVEIRGIPLATNENVQEYVEKIAVFAGVPLNTADINYVQRVSSKKATSDGGAVSKAAPLQPPSIIVSFVQRGKRDSFLRAARAKQPLTSNVLGLNDNSPIYCNEHLTLKRKKLLAKVRSMKAEKNISFVWVQNGSILIRKDEKSRIRAVRNYDDFLAMFQ